MKQPNPTESKAVTIAEADHQWHVAVEEPGYLPVVRSFTNEQWAWNFAQGQRMRLDLSEVTRI
ncbi:hypothetical protein [Mesorhizobium sp.]|uniref:hypothetical protein n=1 Tax=Mesorhizobium sp. TaxID=1871066 RepID=UPI000FE4A023|nr:hypothetical protein [Mesorhizobium sp.]RWG07839.1 MAG: hypothetical protein EOQ54_02860 [Mesorhizobium sp.]RWH02851.1 MAG: hypothetical protein EOQ72_03435 [Mesorhizobium sp.]TIN47485.1 MAG: hypothetical protein E5Y25_05955 [Mesorhizobium sp.]TIR95562.1 MAG: hypothetical protein E5X08_00045 [Mesorhizobium sp.]TIS03502.1 MAG: hypothetical protein E5X13_05650 [Mesorhizobium sp.]